MSTELETEITSWKFKTRLTLTVVSFIGFVPLAASTVHKAAYLHFAAEPTHANVIAASLAELTIGTSLLMLLAAGLAIFVCQAIKGEARESAPEIAEEPAIPYPGIRWHTMHG